MAVLSPTLFIRLLCGKKYLPSRGTSFGTSFRTQRLRWPWGLKARRLRPYIRNKSGTSIVPRKPPVIVVGGLPNTWRHNDDYRHSEMVQRREGLWIHHSRWRNYGGTFCSRQQHSNARTPDTEGKSVG